MMFGRLQVLQTIFALIKSSLSLFFLYRDIKRSVVYWSLLERRKQLSERKEGESKQKLAANQILMLLLASVTRELKDFSWETRRTSATAWRHFRTKRKSERKVFLDGKTKTFRFSENTFFHLVSKQSHFPMFSSLDELRKHFGTHKKSLENLINYWERFVETNNRMQSKKERREGGGQPTLET